ncbi:MAG: hypothetical protein IKH86_03870 [Prevotella sp.]|nr:hypothetical protein [Prevotella sp.]
MATAVSVNISMPRGDISFLKQLGKRMGWTVTEAKPIDALFDPETKQFLNETTMQAIRDVESGEVTRCKDMNELLSLL